MPVTLKDIAVRADVSEMTVSKILNGRFKPRRPRAVARARHIRALADKLGYMPNGAATATRLGRFNNIALLLSTQDGLSSLPAAMLRGIHDGLLARSLNLSVSMLPDDQLIAHWGLPRALRQAMCDGLLVNYTHRIPQRLLDTIHQNHIPSVWLNSKLPTDCVYPDDFGAAEELTRRLLAKGHRRIAYVDFSNDHYRVEERHYSAIDRQGGYERVMRAAGLTPHVVGRHCGSTYGAIKMEMQASDPPTAWITYSPTSLRPIAHVSLTMNRVFGKDYDAGTFDPLGYDVGGVPVLTAREPGQQVGVMAINMLLEKIDGTAGHASVAVPYTFGPETQG